MVVHCDEDFNLARIDRVEKLRLIAIALVINSSQLTYTYMSGILCPEMQGNLKHLSFSYFNQDKST